MSYVHLVPMGVPLVPEPTSAPLCVHYCEVCSQESTKHPAPFWALSRFFINPCCKGCGCETYEEFLANATPEEKAIETAQHE